MFVLTFTYIRQPGGRSIRHTYVQLRVQYSEYLVFHTVPGRVGHTVPGTVSYVDRYRSLPWFTTVVLGVLEYYTLRLASPERDT